MLTPHEHLPKKIAILGSTGSVGTQTLAAIDSINRYADRRFDVVALAAGENLERLTNQVERFRPQAVTIKHEADVPRLRRRLGSAGEREVEIYHGKAGLQKIAAWPEANFVVSALVGAVGLLPTLEAIRAGKTVGLANKETLVIGGPLVRQALAEQNETETRIIPIDSEHSAIFQALTAGNHDEIERLILTASGGPFRDVDPDELTRVSVAETLAHPNWDMGDLITVNSATMVNKGFEVIEAHFLFDIPYERIDVLIHPQSIIHSMVEFVDGSVIAQLGVPDMRIPIQYALTYPDRIKNEFPRLDPLKTALTFREVDPERYPGFYVACDAGVRGGTAPAAVNGGNEVLVNRFLSGKLPFVAIPQVLKNLLEDHKIVENPSLEQVLDADHWGRAYAANV
ncbi:MAG: 1-deoxy-D-xylulose-5-phosphate reductoisomerase [Candidatus Bipolaricaulia bacterium]